MDSKLQKAWPARLLAKISYELSPLPDDENEAARRELAAALRGLTPEDPSNQAQARSHRRMLTLLAENREQRRPPLLPFAWSRPMAVGVAVVALVVTSITGASAMSGVTPSDIIRVLLEVTPLAQGSRDDAHRQMTPTETVLPSQPEQPGVDICENTSACLDETPEATGIRVEPPPAEDSSEKAGAPPKSNGSDVREGQLSETNDRDQTSSTNQPGASIDPDMPESHVSAPPPLSGESETADAVSADDESLKPAGSAGNKGNGPDGNGPPGQNGEAPGNGPDGSGPPGQNGEAPGNGPDGSGPPGQNGEAPGNGPDGSGPPGQNGEAPGNGPDGNGPPGQNGEAPGNGPNGNGPPGQNGGKPGNGPK